ncbi:ABC transporter ATP-binding protein [Alcaligenes sp. SDU_A2]|uniref:ABC transporter ATP-binding protein n=1 Tax=Alcaligenes sp. SDU_A2 TaxID=3136634 RepID=UPI00311F8DB6
MAGADIVFDGLSKRYGATMALHDFHLHVQPGEFMTLLGPSGSGKTTALNALAGFLSPDVGDIRVGGKSVLHLPPEQRMLGMVFQSYTLFPHMNVYDNVAFPLRLRRMSRTAIRSKVQAVLDMVQLPDHALRMPKELSGGQQQRVAFARAIVSEPPVLLMDEPLSALDLKLRQAMQLEIKQYHAALGCSILFVTHDQEEALVLSDRVAVMSEGMIRQVDTPHNIYDRPGSRYVAEFIGKTNLFHIERQTDGGAKVLETGAQVDPGILGGKSAVIVSVRPEKIRRKQAGDGRTSVFVGVAQEVVFLGSRIQYGVRVDSGSLVLVQEHRGAQAQTVTAGSRLELEFSLDDALPVAE